MAAEAGNYSKARLPGRRPQLGSLSYMEAKLEIPCLPSLPQIRHPGADAVNKALRRFELAGRPSSVLDPPLPIFLLRSGQPGRAIPLAESRLGGGNRGAEQAT